MNALPSTNVVERSQNQSRLASLHLPAFNEFCDRHCEGSFVIGEIQCTKRVAECADKNLYVFRTEGVVVLKKTTNRHGGLR